MPKPKGRSPWAPFLAPGAIGLALVLGLTIWVLLPRRGPASDAAQFRGGPRLSVEKDLIDFGPVRFESIVRASFRLRNVGDRPLHLPANPPVEVVEGC
jgi:hypothetical protein